MLFDSFEAYDVQETGLRNGILYRSNKTEGF